MEKYKPSDRCLQLLVLVSEQVYIFETPTEVSNCEQECRTWISPCSISSCVIFHVPNSGLSVCIKPVGVSL